MSSIPLAVLRRIYGADYVVQLDGKPFTVNLKDTVVSFQILAFKKYEVFETALFRKLVKRGDRVVDIGANIGYFSVLFGELAGPEGRVLAIEPEPNNARLLRKNVADRGLDKVVDIAQVAAGESSGTAVLHKASTGNEGDHRLYATAPSEGERPHERIEVPVARVDDLVATWPCVDFIKMDIQGFEPHAIVGMEQTLRSNPGVVLFTEFWPFGLRSAGSDPASYLRTLRDCGLVIWELSDDRNALAKLDPNDDTKLVERIEPNRGYANLLCARTDEAIRAVL